MLKKIILLLFIAAFPALMYAQGCITIFSEDGDKFYLVLNGIKQNPAPQTNVRVDGLNSEFYNAKIIFEDGAKPEITKNVPTKDAGTGAFAEMTYKIKKTRDGELKLRYYSSTPIPVNYTPPPDMYIVHFGQPVTNTVTQSTTTTSYNNSTGDYNTSNAGGGGGVSINVSVPTDANGSGGGVSLNMNMHSGGNSAQSNVQTTTTTTTTTGYGSDGGGTVQPATGGCQYPMDLNNFVAAKQTIGQASFEDSKLSTAQSVIASNCLSSDQVVEICRLFNDDETKLKFAKAAYSRTTDPSNFFKVQNVFNFDDYKTQLSNFISRGGR